MLRIYAEVKRRPLYVVEERLGFADSANRPTETDRLNLVLRPSPEKNSPMKAQSKGYLTVDKKRN